MKRSFEAENRERLWVCVCVCVCVCVRAHLCLERLEINIGNHVGTTLFSKQLIQEDLELEIGLYWKYILKTPNDRTWVSSKEVRSNFE